MPEVNGKRHMCWLTEPLLSLSGRCTQLACDTQPDLCTTYILSLFRTPGTATELPGMLPRTDVGSSYFSLFDGSLVCLPVRACFASSFRSVERSSCALLTKEYKQPSIHRNVLRTLYKYLISRCTNIPLSFLQFRNAYGVLHSDSIALHHLPRYLRVIRSRLPQKIHPFSLRTYSPEYLCI